VALLDGADLLDMRGRGCSFHSHTRTHRSLRSLDDDALARELAGSRAALVGLLGESTYCLAYPYGHVDDRVAAAARAAGYRAALSVHSGFNRRDVDPFRIRRIDVFGTDGPRALVRKVDLGTNDGSWRASLRYRWRQLTDRRPRGAA
jgi:peptidoglycan/xylan/chitin deacetylase (PgdA/CDA1 family)